MQILRSRRRSVHVQKLVKLGVDYWTVKWRTLKNQNLRNLWKSVPRKISKLFSYVKFRDQFEGYVNLIEVLQPILNNHSSALCRHVFTRWWYRP